MARTVNGRQRHNEKQTQKTSSTKLEASLQRKAQKAALEIQGSQRSSTLCTDRGSSSISIRQSSSLYKPRQTERERRIPGREAAVGGEAAHSAQQFLTTMTTVRFVLESFFSVYN